MCACPQKENGFTPIANEILEKLINAGLNGCELACALHIIRKTYGYNKKEDEISLTQFLQAIPRSRTSIINALKRLQLVKITILVKKGTSKKASNKWVFNKNYDSWQLVKKTVPVRRTSTENCTQLVQKTVPTKDNIQNTVSKDTTRKLPNPNIDHLLQALKDINHTTVLDDTHKQNRQYAHLLIRDKILPDLKLSNPQPTDKDIQAGINNLLKRACQDHFHKQNLTRVRYLYYNFLKILNTKL